MEKGEVKLKIQNLFIYYFAFSIVGWILEMIYGYMVFGNFVDRGFLYGPMCPIYGCGVVIVVLITEFFKKKDINNIFIKMFAITILFTILEYMASLILELIFGLRWWDYTNEFLNIHGRVCLIFSLLFGVMGTAFASFVYEPAERLINSLREKVSTKVIWIIVAVLIVISIIDTVISTISYILK